MDNEPRTDPKVNAKHEIPYVRISISMGALGLLILHRLYPSLLPTDTLGIGLLAVCALPWVLNIISEVELPGGWKLKFQELQANQGRHEAQIQIQADQIREQQKAVNELVKFSMSASIFRHLCGIALLREYNYEDKAENRREFYFLRDNGFVKPKSERFLDFNETTPHNVCEIAAATPIGWQCVQLRKAEIPPEMLRDQRNLAVDLTTL